jgi:hypothetical protein
MTRQTIGIGTVANDGTGDTLRSAGQKMNANFAEIYLRLGGDSDVLSTGITFTNDAIVFEGSAVDDFETQLTTVNATADRIVYIPNAGGTIILDSDTQTLTNKTLTSPVLTTPQINDTSLTHQYIITPSELVADRTIFLPLLTDSDTFVFTKHTQTLTNKTLTTPTIASPKVTGTITDANGANLITLTATTDAINGVTFANSAQDENPTFAASGTDSDITLELTGKGIGSVQISQLALRSVAITVNGAASAASSFIICDKATALAVSLADGREIGETKFFVNQNTGDATITPNSLAGGSSIVIQADESCSLIWDGIRWYMYANYNATLNA